MTDRAAIEACLRGLPHFARFDTTYADFARELLAAVPR